VTLDSVGERVGPNYKETVASVTVRSGDRIVAEIEPARRQFASREMTTTQAGLKTLNLGQVYVSIADPAPDGSVPARLYWKPLVTLIWLGAAAMALGGALSLADRRLRFGVAARAKASALAQPAQ
jgi:cytochrome c-type biogenesis protein CcmF